MALVALDGRAPRPSRPRLIAHPEASSPRRGPGHDTAACARWPSAPRYVVTWRKSRGSPASRAAGRRSGGHTLLRGRAGRTGGCAAILALLRGVGRMSNTTWS